eukprot:scaffold16586_cov33-Tisochrysis_lutea.AAC.2
MKGAPTPRWRDDMNLRSSAYTVACSRQRRMASSDERSGTRSVTAAVIATLAFSAFGASRRSRHSRPASEASEASTSPKSHAGSACAPLRRRWTAVAARTPSPAIVSHPSVHPPSRTCRRERSAT